MRSHAHGFLAAGDNDLGITVEQRLIAERNRAQARAAELVDAPGRAFHRDAGGDRGLAGRVLALRRGPWAGVVAKAPLKLPTGVRAALTMTTSFDIEIS